MSTSTPEWHSKRYRVSRPQKKLERHRSARNDWWADPGERNWHPDAQSPSTPDVDWGSREQVMGQLFLPDGRVIEFVDEGPSFGFGRYLDETAESE